MLRIIFYIIVAYIFAKVLGVVLQAVRVLFTAGQSGETTPVQPSPSRQKMPYSNVEDVDYEDITDKK
jgi:hypothetical protein